MSQRTEAQINAARLNGARSSGPVTDRGKAASSRNATTHGLTASTILLPGEDPADFEDLLATLAVQFDAQSGAEMLCIEQMAVAQWKIRRVWLLESTAVRLELAQRATRQAIHLLENPDAPAELSLAWNNIQKQLSDFAWHDVRLQRQYSRSINQLERLRASRRRLEKKQKRKIEPEPPPAPPQPASAPAPPGEMA